jgi:hypothetical protein
MNKSDVIEGRLVRSTTKPVTARIASVTRKDDGTTRVVLNFGWDAPRPRFWPTTVTHVAKYYTLV